MIPSYGGLRASFVPWCPVDFFYSFAAHSRQILCRKRHEEQARRLPLGWLGSATMDT
jgi:hypothetical protein